MLALRPLSYVHIYVVLNLIKRGDNVQIGLVGGSTASEGRVEILRDGTWGTVCNDDWGYLEGRVMCQQLGYLYVVKYYTSEFGEGSGQIWLDDVNCIGNETDLAECQHREWGDNDCQHSQDVGVKCTNEASPIRLVDGLHDAFGSVQIFLEGNWYDVCSREWDAPDALVTCRQLGYLTGTTHYLEGSANNQYLVSGISCSGSENILSECSMQKDSQCPSTGGIFCSQNEDPNETDIMVRLINGTSSNEGIVEVFHNSIWGSVCDIGKIGADLICKHLGYDYGVPTNSYVYGNEAGPIWLNLNCSSFHVKRLSQCIQAWGNAYCDHSRDGGVICERAGEKKSVRLSLDSQSGSVEILVDGEWKIMCIESLRDPARFVICRHMGYERWSYSSLKAEEEQSLWMKVECDGNEISLLQCALEIRKERKVCRFLSIRCFDPEVISRSVQISWSTFPSEGIVEVHRNGLIASVCDDNWGDEEATVVCRQNGYTTGKALQHLVSPTNSIALDGVRCNGSESDLFECEHNGWGVHNCDPASEAAGVVCCNKDNRRDSSQVRLVGPGNGTKGTVQVYHEGEWGYVCDSKWQNIHAEVVCKQLGYRSGKAERGGSMSKNTQDRIVLDMIGPCTGCEVSLLDCPHRPWGHALCELEELARASCIDEGVRLNASTLKLVGPGDGMTGVVQIFHGGEWGFVCDNKWQNIHADFVCKQLGYMSGEAEHGGNIPRDTQERPMLDITGPCTDFEMSTLDCPQSQWGYALCKYNELAIAKCAEKDGIKLSTVNIILVAAVGGLLIALTIVLVYLCRKRSQNTEEVVHQNNELDSVTKETRLYETRGKTGEDNNIYETGTDDN